MEKIIGQNTITGKLNKNILAVTVLDKSTGNAIAKMPLYAEVSAQYTQLPYQIQFLRDKYLDLTKAFWGDSFIEVNLLINTQIATYFPVEKIISITPDDNTINNLTLLGKSLLTEEINSIPSFINNLSLIHQYKEDKTILTEKLHNFIFDFYIRNSASNDLQTFKDNSIFQRYCYPLGFLVTDHVGYASFNISTILQTISSTNHIGELELDYLLYPLGLDANKIALSKLSIENRLTQEVVYAKLEIVKPRFEDDTTSLSLPSMQNPGLADWYISPGSFAAQPNSLLGQDGCEQLLPPNISLHQFNFFQVVRASKVDNEKYFAQLDVDEKKREGLHIGYIDLYRTSWYALGHSLGQILYSLPLAPGETVRLAVLDWNWQADNQRDENTKLTEELLHRTHRDRTISETVKAAVSEWQRGGSVMGGLSSLSGSAGVAPTPTGMTSFANGLGINLGGGYATSSGNRDLRAENVQNLNDSFAQASSAQRELNSTVVVQARQEEKQSIQTRTFSNYNHSHTLTILYYEVLRHFRVVTEWIDRKPALLIKNQGSTLNNPGQNSVIHGGRFIDSDYINKYKSTLENNLLDKGLSDNISAIERQKGREIHKSIIDQFQNKNRKFKFFNLQLRTGGMSRGDHDHVGFGDDSESEVKVFAALYTNLNEVKQLKIAEREHEIRNSSSDIQQFGGFSQTNNTNQLFCFINGLEVINWADLSMLNLKIEPKETNVSVSYIKFVAYDLMGEPVVLFENDYSSGHLILRDSDKDQNERGSTRLALPINKIPLSSPKSPEEIEDIAKIEHLKYHLIKNSDYYDKVIQLNKSTYEIVTEFEASPANEFLLDSVVPTPIAIHGSSVAYPLNTKLEVGLSDSVERDKKAEKLITLPTRGVFAEGKLGHCNISDVIDNTRFWKWEEHPIPILAPEISPVTPVTPSPQSITVEPSTVPATINIQQPAPAPDPQGLAAALTAIVQGNMFRDMSMQTQVNDLLKNLNDNTAKVAQAAASMLTPKDNTAAAAGQAAGGKVSSAGKEVGKAVGDGSPAPTSGSKGAPTSPSMSPQEAMDSKNVIDKLGLSKSEQTKRLEQIANNLVPIPPKGVKVIMTFQFTHETTNLPLDGEFSISVGNVLNLDYEQTQFGCPYPVW